MSQGRVEALADLLEDVPDEDLEAAALEHQLTSKFFPSPSELRALAVERSLHLPAEYEALSQVEARVVWARQPESTRGDPPPIDPLVREALEHVGGYYAFRASDRPAVIRGQFLTYYREMRAETVRAAIVRRKPPALEGQPSIEPHRPPREVS